MTPVVDLEYGLLHAHALDALLEFPEEHGTGHVQSLVVDAQREHEVVEQQVGDLLAPRHLFTGLERGAHVLEMELKRVICYVGKRHIGIEELQGLHLLFIHLQPAQIGISQFLDSGCVAA